MKIWVKWLVLGVLSLAFGIFVLANPVAASIAVTTLAGIMFILAGAFQVFGGFGEDGIFAKILGIALGILMLFLGLSLTLHPLEGMISLATLVTILFAASGITRLISAFQMQKNHSSGPCSYLARFQSSWQVTSWQTSLRSPPAY